MVEAYPGEGNGFLSCPAEMSPAEAYIEKRRIIK
jgi:hypothetical protein